MWVWIFPNRKIWDPDQNFSPQSPLSNGLWIWKPWTLQLGPSFTSNWPKQEPQSSSPSELWESLDLEPNFRGFRPLLFIISCSNSPAPHKTNSTSWIGKYADYLLRDLKFLPRMPLYSNPAVCGKCKELQGLPITVCANRICYCKDI